MSFESKQVFVFPTWRSNISDQYIELISEICEYITNEFQICKLYMLHIRLLNKMYFFNRTKARKISKEIIVFLSNESDKFTYIFSSSKFFDYRLFFNCDMIFRIRRIRWQYIMNRWRIWKQNYQIRREFCENNCRLIFAKI